MTAEFVSEWLSWRSGVFSETPSQRSAKSAISPPLISENIGPHNQSDPYGTFGTMTTRRFQNFDNPGAWKEGHARLRAVERPRGYPTRVVTWRRKGLSSPTSRCERAGE